MGTLFSACSDGQESKKPGAFTTPTDPSITLDPNATPHSSSHSQNHLGIHGHSSDPTQSNHPHHPNGTILNSKHPPHPSSSPSLSAQEKDKAQQEAILKEQVRLETIVSTAGRTMLAIRRRDGYYDPSIAAAQMAQLQSSSSSSSSKPSPFAILQGQIPKSTMSKEDESIFHPSRTISNPSASSAHSSGVGDGNDAASPRRTTTTSSPFRHVPPMVSQFFQEDSMEAFCNLMNPTKERLFHGLDSVVENLP